jgi:hypothetical protein
MIAELETQFRGTTRLLLGTELSGIDDYGEWLGRHVPLPYPAKSAVSGKEVWVAPPHNYLKRYFGKSRLISMDEFEKVNKSPFTSKDLEGAGVKEILAKILKPVAYYCGNFRYQEYENDEKSSGTGGNSRNISHCEDVYFGAKNCAYCNFTSYSESMFGCNGSPNSKFCIHVHNSVNVVRSFEVDGCSNSSDLYFCHNCEAMSHAILCFNAKNLRYAVGNVEVGPEQYARVKKLLLDYVVKELKAKKTLSLDIYNIGCA